MRFPSGAENDSLMNQSFEGLAEIEIPHIPERLSDKAGIEKMHAGMFRTADIHVYGQHFIDDFL